MSVQFTQIPQETVKNEIGEIDIRIPFKEEHVPLNRIISREECRKIRTIFDIFDTNDEGFIDLEKFKKLIEDNPNVRKDLPKGIAKTLLKMHDTDNNGQLDFEEFLKLTQANRWLIRDLCVKYCRYTIPPRSKHSQGIDGTYEGEMKLYPPPLTMIIISIIEIIFFVIDAYHTWDEEKGINELGTRSGPYAHKLMYIPMYRNQIWRFGTYMFVHVGVLHIVMNIIVQIFLGTALEVVHGWWKVAIIYFSGVIAGSIGTSVIDPMRSSLF